MEKEELLRKIPSVDVIIRWWEENNLNLQVERPVLVEMVRQLVSDIRKDILAANNLTNKSMAKEELIDLLQIKVRKLKEKKLVSVINATGVILHTNLGRALLCPTGAEAVAEVACNYSNLELDLSSGERGSRYSHLENYLCQLTGAEAALVVNNNASAVLLTLAALGQGGEAIVSRGELVEIGGAFRIPDVMEQSGVKLVEVGTTNKTYPKDFQRAISENTALLLKVHTSNYRIIGFTRETTRQELVQLGKQAGIPVVEDLGSGCLTDLSKWGITGEPTVQECVRAGVDVVTFSGDKLLGGPQAGIIVGTKEIIAKLKKHPLTRAVRIDKFTVAALEATLKEYINNTAEKNIPTLRMLTLSSTELKDRAEKFTASLVEFLKQAVEVEILPGSSMVGGGALPETKLQTALVAISPITMSCQQLAINLRQGQPRVMVRVNEEKLLIDLRTVFPEQEPELIHAVTLALKGDGESKCIT